MSEMHKGAVALGIPAIADYIRGDLHISQRESRGLLDLREEYLAVEIYFID